MAQNQLIGFSDNQNIISQLILYLLSKLNKFTFLFPKPFERKIYSSQLLSDIFWEKLSNLYYSFFETCNKIIYDLSTLPFLKLIYAKQVIKAIFFILNVIFMYFK